jgi:DNA-binding response OmpR family regulator
MPKKILIVEDEKPLVDAIQESLVGQGFDVKVAENGSGALKALQEYTPDLIILDIVMPDMDGITFLKSIRKPDSLNLHTKVLIFTNLVGEKQWINQMGLEIEDYVVKANSSLADLIERLKNIL